MTTIRNHLGSPRLQSWEGVTQTKRIMSGGWLRRNRVKLKSFIRIIFGFVWLIDGLLKFQPDMISVFPQLVTNAGLGQPMWLYPWFSFWSGVVSQNPAFWVYLVGIGELCIAAGLILGLLRKMTYLVGVFLSLVIWAIPEGLGGPYGPGSTDIGTGVIYSFVFLLFILISVSYGPSKYSLDRWIEKRIKWWKKLAEF